MKRLEEEKKKKAEAKANDPNQKAEEIKDPAMYFENRLKEVKEWKKDAQTFPFPHKFDYTHHM